MAPPSSSSDAADRDLIEILAGFELNPKTDRALIDRCLQLCRLFNVTGDDLTNSWLAYAFNHNQLDTTLTLGQLDALERHLHAENAARLQTFTAPMALRATAAPPLAPATQPLSLPQLTSPPARPRPPTSFISPTIFGSPPAPTGSYAQRPNRGRILQTLNGALAEFSPASREDQERLSDAVADTAEPFRYMYQPDHVVRKRNPAFESFFVIFSPFKLIFLDFWIFFREFFLVVEERVEKLLEVILGGMADGPGSVEQLGSLATASASDVVCGGVVFSTNAANKLHVTDIWLRRGSDQVQLTLPMDEKASWAFFPGMVCVVRGMNPTGSNLVVKQIYIPPALSPCPSLGGDSPSEMSIMYAAGPFTFLDDLAFSPLADLLDEVRRKSPNILILSGPFLDLDNETSSEKSAFEIRQDLWKFITGRLEGIETRVFTIPHIREAHHVACFPQPSLWNSPHSQNMKSKIVHFPNPCHFRIGDVNVYVMTHDVIFHLAANEISKTAAGTQSNRISKLCEHLLNQRSLYPLTVPPPKSSIDWTHMGKYSLESRPDLVFLPSTLGQYARIAGSSVFINPGYLTKGANSPGTYSRTTIHSGSNPIHERTRVDIARI